MNENDEDAAPIGRFLLRILNAQVAVLAAPPHGDRFRSNQVFAQQVVDDDDS